MKLISRFLMYLLILTGKRLTEVLLAVKLIIDTYMISNISLFEKKH